MKQVQSEKCIKNVNSTKLQSGFKLMNISLNYYVFMFKHFTRKDMIQNSKHFTIVPPGFKSNINIYCVHSNRKILLDQGHCWGETISFRFKSLYKLR